MSSRPEDFTIVGCEACGTEGRTRHVTHTYIDFNNGGIIECGWEEPCDVCEGTGGEIVPVEPITEDEASYLANAAAALNDNPAETAKRELWRPDRSEQLAAIEILLASSIPAELRVMLREREQELATNRRAA